MFDEYTRGLVKQIEYVTRFSTLVSDMMGKTFGLRSDYQSKGLRFHCERSTEGNFSNNVFASYQIFDGGGSNHECYITISAMINDENDITKKGFMGKIVLSLEEIKTDTNDYETEQKSVSTTITISPGGPVFRSQIFGSSEKTNIYKQGTSSHSGHQEEISVGNFDHDKTPIENEIDMDNVGYFVLSDIWNRKLLREWFDAMMRSIDEIYDTNFEKDPDDYYIHDQFSGYNK